MSESALTLGELIAIAREIKGLTLREMEGIAGVSNAVINQIETGHVKNPGFWTVFKLARALGLTMERIATTKEAHQPTDKEQP